MFRSTAALSLSTTQPAEAQALRRSAFWRCRLRRRLGAAQKSEALNEIVAAEIGVCVMRREGGSPGAAAEAQSASGRKR